MAKFKPAKGKKAKGPRTPQGGMACVVLVFLSMILVMLFLYYTMRNANG